MYSSFAHRANWVGFGLTLLIHALVLALLFTYAPTREAIRVITPLMVLLIEPESPAPPAPKSEPMVEKLPKPLPMKRVQLRPERETPLPAAQALAADVPAASVPPEPKSTPAIEARPASPAPAALAPAPIVPPSFNADYLDNPAPVYPALARRTGEEGRVLLRVYVEPSGLPSTVEIRTSSGSERLDLAALEAVKRWKFVPARQGDKPVPAFVVVPISFSLRG